MKLKDILIQQGKSPYVTTPPLIKIELRKANADGIKPPPIWYEDFSKKIELTTTTSTTSCLQDVLSKQNRKIIYSNHPRMSEPIIHACIDMENKIIVECLSEGVIKITAIRCNFTADAIMTLIFVMASAIPTFWRDLREVGIHLLYKKIGREKKKQIKKQFGGQTLEETFKSLLTKQLSERLAGIELDRWRRIKRKLVLFRCRQINEREYIRYIETLKKLDSIELDDKISFNLDI